MKVQDILKKKSSDVYTIHPRMTLLNASQLLADHNIGALVVVDDMKMPIGMIAERDIVRQLAAHGDAIAALTVGDVMTIDVVVALPDDDVDYLSHTMTNRRIRHLPVLRDGELIGLVSIGDVVKAQLDFFEGEVHSLQQYIVGGYS